MGHLLGRVASLELFNLAVKLDINDPLHHQVDTPAVNPQRLVILDRRDRQEDTLALALHPDTPEHQHKPVVTHLDLVVLLPVVIQEHNAHRLDTQELKAHQLDFQEHKDHRRDTQEPKVHRLVTQEPKAHQLDSQELRVHPQDTQELRGHQVVTQVPRVQQGATQEARVLLELIPVNRDNSQVSTQVSQGNSQASLGSQANSQLMVILVAAAAAAALKTTVLTTRATTLQSQVSQTLIIRFIARYLKHPSHATNNNIPAITLTLRQDAKYSISVPTTKPTTSFALMARYSTRNTSCASGGTNSIVTLLHLCMESMRTYMIIRLLVAAVEAAPEHIKVQGYLREHSQVRRGILHSLVTQEGRVGPPVLHKPQGREQQLEDIQVRVRHLVDSHKAQELDILQVPPEQQQQEVIPQRKAQGLGTPVVDRPGDSHRVQDQLLRIPGQREATQRIPHRLGDIPAEDPQLRRARVVSTQLHLEPTDSRVTHRHRRILERQLQRVASQLHLEPTGSRVTHRHPPTLEQRLQRVRAVVSPHPEETARDIRVVDRAYPSLDPGLDQVKVQPNSNPPQGIIYRQ